MHDFSRCKVKVTEECHIITRSSSGTVDLIKVIRRWHKNHKRHSDQSTPEGQVIIGRDDNSVNSVAQLDMCNFQWSQKYIGTCGTGIKYKTYFLKKHLNILSAKWHQLFRSRTFLKFYQFCFKDLLRQLFVISWMFVVVKPTLVIYLLYNRI